LRYQGVVFGERASAFWFYGRLSPAVEVPPFYAQEIPVSEGVRIEIVLERLGIWSRPGTVDCKQPLEINQLAQLVVGAWALSTGHALEWTWDGWVEATEARLDGAIMGHLGGHGRRGELDEEAVVSKRVRRAAELAVQLRGNPAYRLALRDIRTSLADPTDDALLFAYRAVEGAGRAITGIEGELGKEGWAQFHEALGVSADEGKSAMKPLTDARDAVAHGDVDPSNPILKERRRELMLLARSLVARTLEADSEVSLEGGIEITEDASGDS
jgi:hypothetical protein